MRVYELAKELKISSNALIKYLEDMDIKKSSVSGIDAETEKLVREKLQSKMNTVKSITKEPEKKKYNNNGNRDENNKNSSEKNNKKYEKYGSWVSSGKIVKSSENNDKSKYKGKKNFYENKNYEGRDKSGNNSFSKDRTKKVATTENSNVDYFNPKTIIQKKFEGKVFKKKEKVVEEKIKHIESKKKTFKKSKIEEKYFPSIDENEITKSIKKTLIGNVKKKKYKKEEKIEESIEPKKIVINEFISVAELAKVMNVPHNEIIARFIKMGQMITISMRLNRETLELICAEFDFDVEFSSEYGTQEIEETISKFDAEEVARPPIVTIMGHVDHGKTSILDKIRKTNVVAGESGGITQHMGAYQILHNGKKISFLDTPGHEAFTAMRARGTNVTDIAIIVVAASEGVKPRTIEAIDHAKAAGVEIIVAINKVDLPEANISKTISQLAEQGLLLENNGGNIPYVECSAKTGMGLDALVELIILVGEMKELKAKKDIPARGVVIKAEKTKNMGVQTTILLKEGTLRRGDNVVCGATYGKVRKMEDEREKEVKILFPSDVTLLYGLKEVPKDGDVLYVVNSDKEAQAISSKRKQIRKQQEIFQSKTNLSNVFQKIKEGKLKDVKIIVKGDNDGSVEAICDSLVKLSNDEVVIKIIHKSVGGISQNDIGLAMASEAIVVGFHVRIDSAAKKLAENEGIDYKIYHIIYQLMEDVAASLKGMLAPVIREKIIGTARIRQIFKIKKVGIIAGCLVESGFIQKECKVRLFRNDIEIFEGSLSSLKHYGEEVKTAKSGTECGLTISDYNDYKENDIVEAYIEEEV